MGCLWDLSFKIKFIKVTKVSQIELAVESFACVQILQISLYKTISTGKSKHASRLYPDFFDCSFIAVFFKFPCNVNLMSDFSSNLIFRILISIAGENVRLEQSPYVALALEMIFRSVEKIGSLSLLSMVFTSESHSSSSWHTTMICGFF